MLQEIAFNDGPLAAQLGKDCLSRIATCLATLLAEDKVPAALSDCQESTSAIIDAALLALAVEYEVVHEEASLLAAELSKHVGFTNARDFVRQDSLLWSASLGGHLAATFSPTLPAPPRALMCGRLGFVAATAGLEAAASARLLQVHILDELVAYLKWELSVEDASSRSGAGALRAL